MNKTFLLLALLLSGCSVFHRKTNEYNLKDYEGKYEAAGGSTLTLQASEMDTTLYAVIDQAKYPLRFVKTDSFTNIQGVPVTFRRNPEGRVVAYAVNGEVYDLLATDFERMEMYPRQALYQQPDAYRYQPPQQQADGLEVGDLNTVFNDPVLIRDMVVETIRGAYPDVHSILIWKDGRLVLEEYFYGFDSVTPHQLRSATKPFIGALVGIAIQEGAVGSVQDRLLPYFKTEYPAIKNLDERKRSITIENFLTYRHGLDCANNDPDSRGNELRMMQSPDWVKYTLDLPMIGKPGAQSSYCTGCALTLGRLVELATGQEIEPFAKAYLFGPMGITNYRWRFAPDPGSQQTFSQMSLTPRDLLKLALLYKNGGKWADKQILPEAWVVKTFDMEPGDYGYLWEHKYVVVDGTRYNSYMASGNGGQKINIWPELDMITVFTGGNYNSYQLYGKSTPPNEMIPKFILPATRTK